MKHHTLQVIALLAAIPLVLAGALLAPIIAAVKP